MLEYSDARLGEAFHARRDDLYDKKRKWLQVANLIAGLAQIISSILIFVFFGLGNLNYGVQVVQPYLKFIEQEGDAPPLIERNEKSLFIIKPAIALGIMCFITAMHHFILVIPVFSRVSWWFGTQFTTAMHVFNWFEYSITASIMMFVLLLLVGENNFVTLLALSAFIGLTQLLGGYLPEAVMSGLGDSEKIPVYNFVIWVPFFLTFLMILVPWIAFFSYYFTSITEVDTTPPWWLTVSFVVTFVVFNLFGLWFALQRLAESKKWPKFLAKRSRRWVFMMGYIVLSLTAKQALTWFIVGGIFART